MSGIFSDQAFVDRLVERVRGRFCYAPAWKLWFENREDFWQPENAEARLRDEYRLTVEEIEEGDGITLSARRKAINATSQQAALWLLREEQRLRLEPEEIAFRLKRPGSDSLHMRVGESRAMEVDGLLRPGALADFLRLAHAHVGEIPNILIRTDHHAPNPGNLFPLAQKTLGQRVVRLEFGYWKSAHLTPAVALKLSGAHMVFLDGLENSYARRHFPQEAIMLLASLPEYPWEGKDGAWHSLRLPTHYVIPGPPIQLPGIELDIRPHLLMLHSRRERIE